MAEVEDGLSELETRADPPGTARHGVEAHVGPYEVVRELGRGGMGAVYLARRADQEYEKLVAIKVVQSGHETDEMLRRFRQERQILAGLDHPNMAKLLDGGATAHGLPYFVMDYVEGEPIDQYCTNRGLPVGERLRLFQSVCGAVAHAHRNLVIHRDIKPANILVTAEGLPKLMDFGIAKLLPAVPSGEGAPAGTVFAFTPAYASPEQVRGETVTTATDVYSLGVVLYELLTGQGPYRVKSHASVEVLRAICEQEPERPSATARGGKRLRGDLDSIVLKALRKEPRQRYSSVDALSEDVQRHLDGRPVAARKGTAAYRAGRFVKRHWIGVSAASLVAAAIVAGAALATYGMVRARRAEGEALREAAKATAINGFLQQTLFSAQPHLGQGREMKVVDALAAAQPLLEESLAIKRAHLGDRNADVAQSINNLGMLFYRKKEYDKAEPLLREALALNRELRGNDNADVASGLNNLGLVLRNKGDHEASIPLFRESLEIVRRVYGPTHAEVGGKLNNLAVALQKAGHLEEAEATLRESLVVYGQSFPADHFQISTTRSLLGGVLTEEKRYTEAEPLLVSSYEQIEQRFGPDHPRTAACRGRLLQLYEAWGKPQQAAALRPKEDRRP